MSWFSKKNTTINKSDVPAKAFITDFLTALGGSTSLKWSFNQFEYLRNYLEVPELASVINIKARSRAKVDWQIISKSTGLPVKNNEPIIRALKRPNYFQSQQEFIMQSVLFQEIFGNEYLYFLSPAGQSNNIKGIFTLPPLIVDIEELNTPPFWLNTELSDRVKYYATWG